MSSQEAFDHSGEREWSGDATPNRASGRPESMSNIDFSQFSFDEERPYRCKELLEHLYLEKELSMLAISELPEFDCSPTTVNKYIEDFEIPKRSKIEAISRGYGYSKYEVPYWNNKDGRDIWCGSYKGEPFKVYVYQLIVIAYGADPYKVFSDEYDGHVHHGAGEDPSPVKYDDRPSNLVFMTNSEHQQTHCKLDWDTKVEIERRYSTEDTSSYKLAPDYDVSATTIQSAIHEVRDKRGETGPLTDAPRSSTGSKVPDSSGEPHGEHLSHDEESQ